jgi:hypothetical protein
VAGWDGWSLSAPRPGKRIVEPGQGDTPDGAIARHDPELGNPFPIVSRVSVEPGTLPRLRVGHTYRLRARTVDLAGNSVPFSERDLDPPDPHLASEAQAYWRFEPVLSPAVLRRHLDTEGESLEHLVIRSNLGITAANYVELPHVKQALADAGAPHTYAEDPRSVPPKSSELMAEQIVIDAARRHACTGHRGAARLPARKARFDPTIVNGHGSKTTRNPPSPFHCRRCCLARRLLPRRACSIRPECDLRGLDPLPSVLLTA